MDTTVWFIRDFLYEQLTGYRCDSTLWKNGHISTPYIYGSNNTPIECGPAIVDPTDDMPFFGEITGITKIESYKDFSIFPNPSADEINITTSGNTHPDVQVVDNLGRLVRSYHHVSGKLTLSQKDFGAGLFVVKLQTEDGRLGRGKFIFQ
jgi:hypothetical protein